MVKLKQSEGGKLKAIGLDPKQVVSPEELLMSQVVSNEAIIRSLVEKGIFSKEEFLKMMMWETLKWGKWYSKPERKCLS